MKLFATSLIVLICFSSLCQVNQNDLVTIPKDYSLAKVGFQVQGVYIFISADPYFEYDYIATVEAKINWSGLSYESFEKVIKKAKKKHTNFNGLIYHKDDLSKADLIRFKEIDISKGGFKIGDKVSFILRDEFNVGEIIKLGTLKQDINVQYINKEGLKEIIDIKPVDLTPISEEMYQKEKREELNKDQINNNEDIRNSNINSKELQVGDQVKWLTESGINLKGEIIEINGSIAKVKRPRGLVDDIEVTKLTKIQ